MATTNAPNTFAPMMSGNVAVKANPMAKPAAVKPAAVKPAVANPVVKPTTAAPTSRVITPGALTPAKSNPVPAPLTNPAKPTPDMPRLVQPTPGGVNGGLVPAPQGGGNPPVMRPGGPIQTNGMTLGEMDQLRALKAAKDGMPGLRAVPAANSTQRQIDANRESMQIKAAQMQKDYLRMKEGLQRKAESVSRIQDPQQRQQAEAQLRMEDAAQKMKMQQFDMDMRFRAAEMDLQKKASMGMPPEMVKQQQMKLAEDRRKQAQIMSAQQSNFAQEQMRMQADRISQIQDPRQREQAAMQLRAQKQQFAQAQSQKAALQRGQDQQAALQRAQSARPAPQTLADIDQQRALMAQTNAMPR